MKPTFLRMRQSNPQQTSGAALRTPTPRLPDETHEGTNLACPQPGTCAEPRSIVDRTRDQAQALASDLFTIVSAGVLQGNRTPLEDYWEALGFLCDVVHVTNEAVQPLLPLRPGGRPAADASVPQYFISSRCLIECYTFLTGDARNFERLHLVTGIAIDGNRYTLEQMHKVPLSHQSHVRAQADQQALTRALIELTESGHALHAIFHSHPGQGALATCPSDLDLATHKRHEDTGYPLIGGIFVKGGVVRFFSAHRPFTITIYGTGVTPVPGENNVFQIQSPSISRDVSYEALTRR